MAVDTDIERLLKKAVDVNGLLSDGNYTKPRSWGVYEVQIPHTVTTTQRFRTGNHPIRHRELEAEFGEVIQIAVFGSKSLVEDLKRLLNGSRV
ncbi:hypothetical protein BH11PSE7_BH11PSE7_15730 [soil metagenome]